MQTEIALPSLPRPLHADEIRRILPHRYPFLLVDTVTEWEPRRRCVGIKNLSATEEYFQGHFPGHPVMPAALIIEAMAQVAGLLAMESFATPTGFFYLAMIEKMRFRHVVRPGDQLVMEATLQSLRKAVFKTHVVGRVGAEIAAEGDYTFVISDTAASAMILRDTIHWKEHVD